MKSKYKDLYNDILNKNFNYQKLKEEQLKIIYNIIQKKKDVLAVLATGFGKSICYQIPFLVTNKRTYVLAYLLNSTQ